jgi:hypothetical protein
LQSNLLKDGKVRGLEEFFLMLKTLIKTILLGQNKLS